VVSQTEQILYKYSIYFVIISEWWWFHKRNATSELYCIIYMLPSTFRFFGISGHYKLMWIFEPKHLTIHTLTTYTILRNSFQTRVRDCCYHIITLKHTLDSFWGIELIGLETVEDNFELVADSHNGVGISFKKQVRILNHVIFIRTLCPTGIFKRLF
jgi:hypothetical protein